MAQLFSMDTCSDCQLQATVLAPDDTVEDADLFNKLARMEVHAVVDGRRGTVLVGAPASHSPIAICVCPATLLRAGKVQGRFREGAGTTLLRAAARCGYRCGYRSRCPATLLRAAARSGGGAAAAIDPAESAAAAAAAAAAAGGG